MHAIVENNSFTLDFGRTVFSRRPGLAAPALRREGRWREALIQQAAPRPQETILDVGCGTGTLAVLLKLKCPQASIYGLDPDADNLDKAEVKARRRGALVHFTLCQGQDLAACTPGRPPHKIVLGLVLHQMPLPTRRAMLSAMVRALRPGGSLHIADYDSQHSSPQGLLPQLLADAGFAAARQTRMIATPTGAISLYRAQKD